MEVIAKREVEGLAEEEAQEEVEDEAPEIRKSKRLARGKAKVIYPRIPKKDLLKLDEVPRKKRKLLDTSSAAAATAELPQLPALLEVQPAPPSELVEVVAPIAMEADVSGTQSPTLMIQGVLGELAPWEEVIEAPRTTEEEEDSISTLGKEDAEDGKAVGTVQIVDVPAGQLRLPPAIVQPGRLENIPQGQACILIEESVPEAREVSRHSSWVKRLGLSLLRRRPAEAQRAVDLRL